MPSVDEGMVCPGCGASVSLDQKTCDYCGRRLTFTSIKDVRKQSYKQASEFLKNYQGALSGSPDDPNVQAPLGFNLFDKGQFAEAEEAFRKASEGTDDPDILWYLALSKFRQQKPFEIKMERAKEIIAHLNNAIDMNPAPQYLVTKALVVNTVFERRFVKFPEKSAEILQEAGVNGLTSNDHDDVRTLMGLK